MTWTISPKMKAQIEAKAQKRAIAEDTIKKGREALEKARANGSLSATTSRLAQELMNKKRT